MGYLALPAERPGVNRAARSLAYPLAVSLILLLAALLRFYQLSGQSLWADEGNSVALAHQGLVEIARRTAFDIHPPLYYWLLKGWIGIFGDSEIGLRSLSAVLGVGLVYLVNLLGARLFNRRVGLLAALIAACSPFQVYYSQEARMYMLLALLSSLTVLAALVNLSPPAARPARGAAGLGYGLVVAAGLYTHYAYPVILLAVNLAALPRLARQPKLAGRWLGLHLLPLLLYLPWLPTAWRQVTTWPSERQATSLGEVFTSVATTLLLGLSWPKSLELLPAIAIGILLVYTLRRPAAIYAPRTTPEHIASFRNAPRFTFHATRLTLLLWFLLPVLFTVVIFTPAFLKFLLVAAPAVALMLALAIDRLVESEQGAKGSRPSFFQLRRSIARLAGTVLLAGIVAASAVSLYAYYTDPAYARDNYRGIVQFIRAVSGPGDAVILHAEGQQDIFNYYYNRLPGPAVPVYPLPRQRPLDKAATLAELEAIAGHAGEIYVVYWATRQADPAGLIEGWLDSTLVKATDQWYGNVRLASYASPAALSRPTMTPAAYGLGDGSHLRLAGYGLAVSAVRPGDILPVFLDWQTDAPPEPGKNYTVFIQVLDEANHLAGQRDALPLTPVPDWIVGRRIADMHGIFIEPGTPPGRYRVIAGLYASDTGQRLPVFQFPAGSQVLEEAPSRDFIELGQLDIGRPARPFSPEAIPMQVRLGANLGEVCLAGYDLYKSGYRSAPAVPLKPGDLLHFVAYWQRCRPGEGTADSLSIQVITSGGQATPLGLTSSLVGTAYPLAEWHMGEIVRGQYDLFLTGLEPGRYRLAVTLQASQPATVETKLFRVE